MMRKYGWLYDPETLKVCLLAIARLITSYVPDYVQCAPPPSLATPFSTSWHISKLSKLYSYFITGYRHKHVPYLHLSWAQYQSTEKPLARTVLPCKHGEKKHKTKFDLISCQLSSLMTRAYILSTCEFLVDHKKQITLGFFLKAFK